MNVRKEKNISQFLFHCIKQNRKNKEDNQITISFLMMLFNKWLYNNTIVKISYYQYYNFRNMQTNFSMKKKQQLT